MYSNSLDPLEQSHNAIKGANMRPHARQALLEFVLHSNDRELKLARDLLRAHLKARQESDALIG